MYFISLSIIISSHLRTVTTVEIMIFFACQHEWNGMDDIICVLTAEYTFARSHDAIYSSKSNSSSQFRYPFNDGSNIYYYYIHLSIQHKKYI